MKERYVIGTNRIGYPERRNFVDLPLQDYRFRKVPDLFSARSWIRFRTTGRLKDRSLNSFQDLDLNACALYHFFNTISLGRKPWLTTFETRLPRWGDVEPRLIERGMRAMAASSCKGLIALSSCTAAIQRRYLTETTPALAEEIGSKMTVMHPAQPVLWRNGDAKPALDHGPTFVFIGRDFFRKGGREVLRAFVHLHERGMRDWRLAIISSMDHGDYVSRTDRTDVDEAMRMMMKYPDHITHHFRLDNRGVLDLLLNAHVGLLPTWADTYGYSVLEAQASGCPVISTDIRALPEINSTQCGWLLPVPKDDLGFGVFTDPAQRDRFGRAIMDGLVDTLEDLLRDPGLIAQRQEAALTRIREHHDPRVRAAELETLYARALRS